jgi:subtilisin family serine protease
MRNHSMARWASVFVLITLFVLALPLMGQTTPPSAPRDVLVKFRAVTAQALEEVVRQHDIEDAKWVGGTGVIKFRSRSQGVAAMVRALSARADVLYAEPDYIVTRMVDPPNDPSYGSLWAMPKISAPGAWDSFTGSASVVVGVVDTGIDYTHPDLAANVWSAPDLISLNGVTCDAGTHGYNAIKSTCDPADDNSHGTHVSGTIGAVGNNDTGVVGVNWNTSIMGLKFLNAQGSGYTSDAVDAIEFAIQAKRQRGVNVRVLSNSWGGGGYSQGLFDEIDWANTNNILFVVAAGNDSASNDSTPTYPANYNLPNIVAVAATDSGDNLASFSNYGSSTVGLAAPGVNILSTIRRGSYAYYSGTSMATPHVSGAAALILSKCTGLNTAGVKAAILNNVDPVGTLTGKVLTGGRLNVSAAINGCSTAPPPVIASLSVAPSSQSVKQGSSVDYTVEEATSGATPANLKVVSRLPSKANWSASGKTLTITTSRSTPRGTYALQIQGTVDGVVLNTTATLIVTR